MGSEHLSLEVLLHAFFNNIMSVICTHLFSTGKKLPSFYVVRHGPNITNHRDQTACQICYKFQHDSDRKTPDFSYSSLQQKFVPSHLPRQIPNAPEDWPESFRSGFTFWIYLHFSALSHASPEKKKKNKTPLEAWEKIPSYHSASQELNLMRVSPMKAWGFSEKNISPTWIFPNFP